MSYKFFLKKPVNYTKLAENHKEWIAVAERIVRGDYNSVADSTVVASLVIGLRGYPDVPVCQRALDMIKKL